jgi:hypothetical protein
VVYPFVITGPGYLCELTQQLQAEPLLLVNRPDDLIHLPLPMPA